ncbi:hypothetical protein J2772_001774 [Chryseobacterium jejuense]|nr:hypothetical protein [Chryseobacterium jejuense]
MFEKTSVSYTSFYLLRSIGRHDKRVFVLYSGAVFENDIVS